MYAECIRLTSASSDGLLWSPSRIVGNFLVRCFSLRLIIVWFKRKPAQVYREINERTSSRGSQKKAYPEEIQARSLGRRNSPDNVPLAYKTSNHGGGEQGTFKAGGLIKKVSIHGCHSDTYD